MKDFTDFKIYTTVQEIKEIQSVKAPTSDDIRLADGNVGLVRGYSVAYYNRKNNKYTTIARIASEDECIESIRTLKQGCLAFPEALGNWYTEIGDIYIYKTDGWNKPNWGLHGIVIEE